MRSLWLENQTLSFRTDAPLPVLGAGQALVRVRQAGICSTDLALLNGYYHFAGIPGHEFVGEVVEAPEAPDWVGQRVVGEISIACGVCSTCRAGRRNHCERRATLGIRAWDGAFAEYLKLPLANLHRVPDSLSDEQAVFTEPLAAALRIQQQVPNLPAAHVLVVGAGRLGLLVAQSLALTGCDLQVVARHPRQRELLERQGIAWLDEDKVPDHQVDVVVDATGVPAGFTLARQAVRPLGTLVLKSTYKEGAQVDLSSLVVDEVTIVGSRCGPFDLALQLLESGQVDPLPYVEAHYPLEQGLRGFENASQPGRLKVLLQP